MMRHLRVGLTLTGGGLAAAYQVGVLRALGGLPIDIAAISAVGAGALNGAVVACAGSAREAAEMLSDIWRETVLAEQTALQLGPIPVLRLGTYLTFLFASGVTPKIEERLRGATGRLGGALQRRRILAQGQPSMTLAALQLAMERMTVSTDAELDRYLSEGFREAAAQPRLPFWVSVYESDGSLIEFAKHGLQLLGMMEAGTPHYLEVSDPALSREDRLQAVLASTSLPFLCESASFGERRFIDGSFGGMKRSAGAVPITPLRRRRNELKLDLIVVVHTDTSTSWDATEMADTPVIEIRPSTLQSGTPPGYFWSDHERLHQWIALGEQDARAALAKLASETARWHNAGKEHLALLNASLDLDDPSR